MSIIDSLDRLSLAELRDLHSHVREERTRRIEREIRLEIGRLAHNFWTENDQRTWGAPDEGQIRLSREDLIVYADPTLVLRRDYRTVGTFHIGDLPIAEHLRELALIYTEIEAVTGRYYGPAISVPIAFAPLDD